MRGSFQLFLGACICEYCMLHTRLVVISSFSVEYVLKLKNNKKQLSLLAFSTHSNLIPSFA